MLICLCRGITDRDVEELVARGVEDLDAIKRRTGAGTECRLCLADLEAAYREGLRARDKAQRRRDVTRGRAEG